MNKKIKALKTQQAKNVDTMVKKNAKLEKKIFALALKKLQNRIEKGKPWAPKVGDLIYTPTRLYLEHGQDDITGGLATITGIKDDGKRSYNSVFVTFKEIENSYNWTYLLENQKADSKQYGKEFAHPDPELFEANEVDWQ
jgi:hypothetical protein